MKIAINGLGRIGRIFLRQVLQKEKDLKIIAINDLADKENLLYLLANDTIYGKFDYDKKTIEKIKFLQEKDPANLPWKNLEIDIVVESTGVFSSYEKAKPHLEAGAKRVVITAPVSRDDLETKTFTPNLKEESAKDCLITSNASCTTNAVMPIVAILSKNPGIKRALLNTAHAYTATQGLVDGPSKKDYRRGRSAAMNIVPSSTGAAEATSRIMPEMKGKFDGLAMRVPVINGSIIDLTFISERPTSSEEINSILKEASEQKEWEGILKIAEESSVSSDITKESFGSIVDLEFTRVVGGDLVKILSWYDNEWGYCAMLIKHIESLKKYL